jgi:hypothetical protein
MGAVVVNMVAARAGINLLDGAEDAAMSLVDDSGNYPVVEMDVQTVAWQQDGVPPFDDNGPVDVNVDVGNAWDEFTGWLGGLLRNDTTTPPRLPEPSVDDPGGLIPAPAAPGLEPAPVPLPEFTPTPELPPPQISPDTPLPSLPLPSPSSPPPPPEADIAPAPHPFETPPRDGEYLWTYMRRSGVPPEAIMAELERAADELEKATDSKVEWHGSGKKRWLEINGKSDTLSLWQALLPYLKN